ncbi:MAG: nitroreductase [Bacillota bacterium]
MNDIMKCILERRSIRKYKSKQITEAELNTILEAGLYAPSAGSRQGPVFIVTQDKELNEKLGRINKSAFHGKISTANSYISKDQPSIADDERIVSGFYGAPTIVTIFATGNFLYNEGDCSVAAENMMLAAYSLGIGSCMVARANETFSSDYGKELLKKWNMNENYKAFYHVLLGYPDSGNPKAKPRKEGRIIRVR